MDRYESFKETKLPWIGNIPNHWNLSLVGRHFEIGRGRVISKVEIEDNKGDYPVYSSQTSNNGELGRINTYDFDGEYVTWTTDGVNTGTCFFRSGKFNTTNVCGMLSLRNTPYSLPFLSYYLNQVTKPYVRIDINPKLMNNMMSEIPLVLPPLSEQQQIVSFLDSKTTLIDSLIEKTKLKIELLKEKRTSLINEVVTKGLNPNIEMKDSGVEWIGEIPSGWLCIPIKYITEGNKDSIRTGPFGSSLKSDEFKDEGIRVYNQRSVYDEDFSKSNLFVSDEKYRELKSFEVIPKDVLITSRGTIGRMTVVPDDGEIGVLHPCLIRLRLNREIISDRFLWFYMNQSSLFLTSVLFESNSTTIEVIYSETLSNVRFPLPPLSEQQEIVEYLDEQTQLIDKTISIEEKRIELLKEYRQSLISEVVTGKRKVVE